MSWFSRFLQGLAAIAAGLFTLAGVMLTWEVAARYFFTRPTVWAAELSQLALIWGTMLAMAWALEARRHIAVDVVVRLLPPAGRRMTDALAMLAIVFFSAVTLWKGAEIFWDSFERGRTTGSLLNLPAWIAELAVPVGFALLLAQSVVQIVRLARGAPPEPPTQPET